jgi:RNA polymerase sigma factor (sigma-70 family)
MDQPSDAELWHQAGFGSDAAFGVLFERHAKAVYNYCFRRTADWAAAEDLMSATFLEAWRRRDEVQMTGDSIRPWLLGVATNLMRNDRRSRRRRAAALQRLQARSPAHGHDEEVSGRIDDERQMKELLSHLERLPADQQEAIALVLWSGLSYATAGIALGIPAGTVKSRVSRGRQTLMELFGAPGHDTYEQSALARASVTHPSEVEG